MRSKREVVVHPEVRHDGSDSGSAGTAEKRDDGREDDGGAASRHYHRRIAQCWYLRACMVFVTEL